MHFEAQSLLPSPGGKSQHRVQYNVVRPLIFSLILSDCITKSEKVRNMTMCVTVCFKRVNSQGFFLHWAKRPTHRTDYFPPRRRGPPTAEWRTLKRQNSPNYNRTYSCMFIWLFVTGTGKHFSLGYIKKKMTWPKHFFCKLHFKQ